MGPSQLSRKWGQQAPWAAAAGYPQLDALMPRVLRGLADPSSVVSLHKMPVVTSRLVSYPHALGFPVNSDLLLLAAPCQEAVSRVRSINGFEQT